MLDQLSREERLLLLEFVCAYAWTDLEIQDGERRFVEGLMRRLNLSEEDRVEVEQWLSIAPPPADIDPARVPPQHRRTFIEAVRAVMYADGAIDDEERELFEKLKAALQG